MHFKKLIWLITKGMEFKAINKFITICTYHLYIHVDIYPHTTTYMLIHNLYMAYTLQEYKTILFCRANFSIIMINIFNIHKFVYSYSVPFLIKKCLLLEFAPKNNTFDHLLLIKILCILTLTALFLWFNL